MAYDEVTGIEAQVVARVMGAHRADPQRMMILLGDMLATPETVPAAYRADGEKLYGIFNRHLPSGTFTRLVCEYLRAMRREATGRLETGGKLDKALLEVIVALGEKFSDTDNSVMTDPIGE